MIKKIIKRALVAIDMEPKKVFERLCKASISLSLKQEGLDKLVGQLRVIVPDISSQEEIYKSSLNDYLELKIRGLQAFQCKMMLKAIGEIPSASITVVDIGDSAGTHMLYLKELLKNERQLETISVNLDPRAINKIKARGLKAILCRAEELDLPDKHIDMFTSFEMVEHLHNPSIFFRRLAKRSSCKKMLITVPYLKQSRVGLHNIRHNSKKEVFAEDEHIFELSPSDWELLLLHSGWKVVYSNVYYQYPKKIPLLNTMFACFWRKFDYEGFWGAIIEKDISFSDCYKDWEE